MKKITTATSVMLLATNALAVQVTNKNTNNPFNYGTYYPIQRNPYYFKAELGITGFSDINMQHATKARVDLSYYQAIGVGAYLTDRVRSDLMLTHNNETNFNFKVPEGHYFKAGSGSIKSNINTMMLNLYYDVYEYNSTQIFVGGGLGLAKYKAIYRAEYKGYTNASGAKITAENVSYQTKQRDSFAYQFMTGVAYNISDGVNLEAGYAWKHIGKFGHLKSDRALSDSLTNAKYRGHSLSLGVRFDLDSF